MSNLHSPKLTATFVKAAAPGKYTDGHGLTLFVQPSGSRQWVQRLVIHGRRREMGLGGYPLVTEKSSLLRGASFFAARWDWADTL